MPVLLGDRVLPRPVDQRRDGVGQRRGRAVEREFIGKDAGDDSGQGRSPSDVAVIV
jgi:hypothetical protein